MRTLKLSHERAKEESYSLARVISCNLIETINNELNNPSRCLCEKAIPQVKECTARSIS